MRCCICHSENHSFHIETGPMMVDVNKDRNYRFLLCNHCDSVFLENPIDEQDLSAFYSDYYLPYRGEKAWGKYAGIVRRQDHLLNLKKFNLVAKHLYLKNQPQVKILDIGCGKPDFLYEFKQQTNAECFGIDFKSAQWVNPKYAGINLSEESVGQFNSTERFDVITAWHYLEHDYDPVLTINKCYEHLKPGGLVIIEVPMYQGLLAKIQKKYWQGWHTPRHINLFSFKSWDFLFPKSKWKIVDHQKYGTLDPFILWWLGRAEKNNIIWNTDFDQHFFTLALLKCLTWPLFVLEKYIPLGIQTVIVEKK